MAYGLPVIAYEVAVEGMDVEHGRNVMIAHGAADFADHIVKLYENCSMWSALSRGGLELISRHYTERTAHAGLMGAMQAVHMHKPEAKQRHCRARHTTTS